MNLNPIPGVPLVVKDDTSLNKEWKNYHFHVITDNDPLAIEIELQNGDKVILVPFTAQMVILV